MDYEKIYNDLIEKAKSSICVEGGYFEKHHIIPKSLGGTNDASNLVKLTARQHYIAHLLLYKIYKDKCVNGVDKTPFYKMLSALGAMVQFPAAYDEDGSPKRFFKFGSLTYEQWKVELFKLNRERSKNLIKSMTEEEKIEHSKKISAGIKRFIEEHGSVWNGRHHSDETKEKMRKYHSEFHPQKGNKNSQFGTKCMFNEELRKTIHVKSDDVQKYLNLGWKLGAVYNWELYFNRQLKRKRCSHKIETRSKPREGRIERTKQYYTEMYTVYCEFGFDAVKEQFDYRFSQVNFVNQCKRYVDGFKPQNGKKRGK